ncbi:MAG: hypothetical protein SNJ70_06790 [Armatimonadota bacterium]
MWIGIALIWVLASVGLYSWLIRTSKDAPNSACVECKSTNCTDCPYLQNEYEEIRRAA